MMSKIVAVCSTVLLLATTMSPNDAFAKSDEECGPSAKSLFFEVTTGKLESDGGRPKPVVPSAGKPSKPKDKPAVPTCRNKPASQVAAVPAAPVVTTTAAPVDSPHTGLAFWVETLRCGATNSRRTTEYRFVTGDCAKFFFKPNIDGYMYVANVDSNNKVDYLFPQRGENNFLKAREDANFGVEFIGAPGIERVFVLFSKSKIANVPEIALKLASRGIAPPSVKEAYGVMLADTGGQLGRPKSLRRTEEAVSATNPDGARYMMVANSELVSLPVIVLNLDLVHTSN